MTPGRMPAQIVDTFDGDSNNLSSSSNNKAIITQLPPQCQALPWPNYCSHIPSKPEFFQPPVNHKQRSLVIVETMNRLEESYHSPKKKLITMQNRSTTGAQVKSPRRVAAISLLKVMLYYVDDATGRVGRRSQNGNFEDLSIGKLASYAELRIKRAKRAMKDIIRAGYLFVTRQWRQDENGDIYALPSIKEFTPKFFLELDIKGDLWTKWFSLKKWKKEQLEKKEGKIDKRKMQAVSGLIAETGKYARTGVKRKMKGIFNIVKKIPEEKPFKSQRLLNHERRLRDAAMMRYRVDPDISLNDHYKILVEKYPYTE